MVIPKKSGFCLDKEKMKNLEPNPQAKKQKQKKIIIWSYKSEPHKDYALQLVIHTRECVPNTTYHCTVSRIITCLQSGSNFVSSPKS